MKRSTSQFVLLAFLMALADMALAKEGVVFATEEDLVAFDRMVSEAQSKSKPNPTRDSQVAAEKGLAVREQVHALVKSETSAKGKERALVMTGFQAEERAHGLRGTNANSGRGVGAGGVANPSDRVPLDRGSQGRGRARP